MKDQKLNAVGSDFQDHLNEDLRDPHMAAEYLMAAIEAGDLDYFKVALGNVAKAHGISNIAQITEIPRPTLYNILKENSNPSLTSIQEVLNACGLTIAVTSKVEPLLDRNSDLVLIASDKAMPRSQVVKKLWEYIKSHGLEREVIEVGEKEIAELARTTHRLVGHSKSLNRSHGARGTKKTTRK
jgi:probable addiction module antidote protein